MANLDKLKSRYESGYLPSIKKSSKSNVSPHKRRTIIVFAVIILILVVGGAWFLTKHKSGKLKNLSVTQTVEPATGGVSKSTTTYVSNGNDLNLTFNYPSNWSVTPPSHDNSTDQTITVSSPLTSIFTATNSTVTGRVVMEVRPASATINELNANSPIEAITSTQIAYSQPTANQYQYPYVSYIHFSNGSNVSGAFEEVMVTGSQILTQNEPLSGDYLAGLDPIISASFYKCSNPTCTGSSQTPLSINGSTWQNAPIFQAVLTMFESFQLN